MGITRRSQWILQLFYSDRRAWFIKLGLEDQEQDKRGGVFSGGHHNIPKFRGVSPRNPWWTRGDKVLAASWTATVWAKDSVSGRLTSHNKQLLCGLYESWSVEERAAAAVGENGRFSENRVSCSFPAGRQGLFSSRRPLYRLLPSNAVRFSS